MTFLSKLYYCLTSANSGDLYIYPAFVAIVDTHKEFGLIDIRELEFNFHGQRFLEEEKVPKDAVVVDHTWAKVNKNGTPDKRFKDNYQIPICEYGEIELTSATGLNEAYSLSSFEKARKFAQAMTKYQELLPTRTLKSREFTRKTTSGKHQTTSI